LYSGESCTFPKVRRKEKNKNKNVTSGIYFRTTGRKQHDFLPNVSFSLDVI
jgi:hypothetical protein